MLYKTFSLLHRSLAKALSIHTKKVLYISLVRSKLTYCSPIWQPQYMKDMQLLETLQGRATKFILNDYKSCYRSRLLTLRMLPLMMQLEIIDILFFVTSIKHPTERFDILEYVTFSSASMWSSSKCKLVHTLARINHDRHFYFNRLPRLWNSLPSIDLNQSVRSIKQKLKLLEAFCSSFQPRYSMHISLCLSQFS